MITVTPVAADDARLATLLDSERSARPDGAGVDLPAAARFLLATGAGRTPTGYCALVPVRAGVAELSHLYTVSPGVERALLAAAERLAARLGEHTLLRVADPSAGLEAAGYRPVDPTPADRPGYLRYAKRLDG